jgi:hypothetical protein
LVEGRSGKVEAVKRGGNSVSSMLDRELYEKELYRKIVDIFKFLLVTSVVSGDILLRTMDHGRPLLNERVVLVVHLLFLLHHDHHGQGCQNIQEPACH